MLYEKLRTTIGLIEDVADNRQRENDNINVAKRNSIFFDSLEKLTPSIKSYLLARKHFGFDLQVNTADVLTYVIEYSKKTFDECKAVNPSQFKQKAETLIEAITHEWTTYYKAANSELINGLNIIVLVHPTPNVVRNCITTLNKCEKLPLSQDNINAYMEAKHKAEDLLNEMKFDDEIKDFLIKVRDKRASLSDLTPKILEWIRSENISDKVSLSIKNTVF